jgi:hypothetical protein
VAAHPYYKHPVTGVIEDSGQNPGIGQGMTESVLGGEALLEVYADGSVYVTVRFSLMDNIDDIKLSVQRDAESEYVPAEFAVMKEAMGEGSDAKADIRFAIPGLDAIARAEFFVTAMGRDVVFFMNFTDPVPGEGDFIVSPDEGADEGAAMTYDAAEAAVPTASGGGMKIDVRMFLVIAALIVAAAVVCGVALSRRKPKRDSR